jgi:hypothetical protein
MHPATFLSNALEAAPAKALQWLEVRSVYKERPPSIRPNDVAALRDKGLGPGERSASQGIGGNRGPPPQTAATAQPNENHRNNPFMGENRRPNTAQPPQPTERQSKHPALVSFSEAGTAAPIRWTSQRQSCCADPPSDRRRHSQSHGDKESVHRLEEVALAVAAPLLSGPAAKRAGGVIAGVFRHGNGAPVFVELAEEFEKGRLGVNNAEMRRARRGRRRLFEGATAPRQVKLVIG